MRSRVFIQCTDSVHGSVYCIMSSAFIILILMNCLSNVSISSALLAHLVIAAATQTGDGV